MLNGMTALVGRHGCRRNAAPLVNIRAKVDRLGHGVVVVGKEALPLRDFHVTDAVVPKHGSSDFGTAHIGP